MPFPIASPTTCFVKMLKRVYDTFAQSSEFQSFVGADDEATAGARIHVFETPRPAIGEVLSDVEWQALHPLLVLLPPDDGNMFDFNLAASGRSFTDQFSVQCEFHRFVDDSSNESSLASIELIEDVGKVFEDIRERKPAFTNYFSFTSATFEDAPHRAKEADQVNLGDIQSWGFVLNYSELNDG